MEINIFWLVNIFINFRSLCRIRWDALILIVKKLHIYLIKYRSRKRINLIDIKNWNWIYLTITNKKSNLIIRNWWGICQHSIWSCYLCAWHPHNGVSNPPWFRARKIGWKNVTPSSFDFARATKLVNVVFISEYNFQSAWKNYHWHCWEISGHRGLQFSR